MSTKCEKNKMSTTLVLDICPIKIRGVLDIIQKCAWFSLWQGIRLNYKKNNNDYH